MFNFNKTKQLTILPRNSDFMKTFEGNADHCDLNYHSIQTRPVKKSRFVLIKKPIYMEEEETLLVLKKYFVDEMTMAEAGKSVDMPRSTAGRVIRHIKSRLNLLARRFRMHKYASLEEYEKTLCKYVKTMLLQEKL
ncbi:hypothetical protein J3Q64DRAFT_1702337 [Phycomyces blakesleeanus]|uniref:Uncharacterized protein n=2 Tax=Phycomyces blakesleeanus TaxID=4837 RepID=A0A167N2R4_PHYB8|nr:hypothetical protein PHYBLDRAFT_144189 [Phycomyces blakesleeanus NRRL 1555(-)]OAD74829.1 hypothetical protein PHYBLDRAFT_144189 [Phycomyces blakesleeanus NRRL 1555(-)]|eukprot:XP_018292869.1 hypothetical protein PHYBLDRAFT_144189 [Phycomyces blakesleeanus NRRL 1555(-)]